jgi:hypothetical protein
MKRDLDTTSEEDPATRQDIAHKTRIGPPRFSILHVNDIETNYPRITICARNATARRTSIIASLTLSARLVRIGLEAEAMRCHA